jgi:hypothetical protein
MDTRPVILVCGCQKYRQFLEAAIRRFLCANDEDWHVVGVLGGSDGSEARYDPATHLLTLPVPDTYEALPQKIVVALRYITTHWPDAVGVFKTDDDILFDYGVLLRTLAANTKEAYWGHITEKCRTGFLSKERILSRFADTDRGPTRYPAARYCYGIGYWLRRDAVDIVLHATDELIAAPIEDIWIGAVLNRRGIYPTPIPLAGCEERPRDEKLLGV